MLAEYATDTDTAEPWASTAKLRRLGSTAVAEEAVTNTARARLAQTALVDGAVGIIVAPRGRLTVALHCKALNGRIVEFDVIAVPERLKQLDISVLPLSTSL